MVLTVATSTLSPPEQKTFAGLEFPLILTPAAPESVAVDDFLSWVKEHKEDIEAKVGKYGAVLLRGFPVQKAEEFDAFLSCFDWTFGSYLGGGGPRIKVVGNVKTSTESPPEFTIPLHHEMAYISRYPSKLAFCCDVPATSGGATPICPSDVLLSEIEKRNKAFLDQVRQKKVRYVRVLSDKNSCDFRYQKSWQDIYETDSKEEAEQRARESGTEFIEWLEDGSMKATTVAFDGTIVEKRTGKEIWFNATVLLHPAAHGKRVEDAPWRVTYGDHSPVAGEDVLSVLEIMKELQVEFLWKKGDILLVDNFLALHGRNSFTPPRMLWASLIE